MNCLLAAATVNEIAPFLDHYRKNGNEAAIDIIITGIGLMATAYSLAKQVSLKRPGLIIQAGIAGCFDKNISPGTVVVVKQDTIADLGVIENKQLRSVFDLKLISPGQFPFQKGWLVNSDKNLLGQTKLKTVAGISVNQVTTAKQMIELYRNKFGPAIESMEGAALHYVSLSEKIPFLQIRAISNYIGERDKKKWNMKEAITNLNKELIGLFNRMSNPKPVISNS
jgi:futalosine hydrolase